MTATADETNQRRPRWPPPPKQAAANVQTVASAEEMTALDPRDRPRMVDSARISQRAVERVKENQTIRSRLWLAPWPDR